MMRPMSGPRVDKRIWITTEEAEAGPTAFIAAVVSWGMGAAIVMVGAWWVGFRAATDVHVHDFNPLPLFFGACFGLLGTYFLLRGVLHTLRYRKYGSSVLEVNEARLGQELKGVLRTASDLSPLADFKVRLRCDRRTSSRSVRGGWTTMTSCLWDSVQTVPATTRSSEGIPIRIAIPDDGIASGSRQSGRERVTWGLEVRVPLQGTDYFAEFPIKVGGHRKPEDLRPHLRGTS
jgi:hypothetical protein